MPRKAPVPSPGTTIPRQISETGLVVEWRPDEQDARTRTIDLTCWPGAETLRREAARALAVKFGPVGTWRTDATARVMTRYVRVLLRWCEESGIDTFRELSEARWLAFLQELSTTQTSGQKKTIQRACGLLLDDVTELPQRTRWAVRQRVGAPAKQIQDAYAATDFRALERAAHRVVVRAHRRITANEALADTPPFDVPEKDQARAQALRRLLAGDEPSPYLMTKACGNPADVVTAGRAMHKHHLFLTNEEVVAAAVLLVCKEGFNISTLERQVVADPTAGEGEPDLDVFTADLDKRRRGGRRHFANTYVDDGPDARGNAYRLVHEATEPARRYLRNVGKPTALLLIYASMTKDGVAPGKGRSLAPGVLAGVAGGNIRRADGGPRHAAAWLPDGLVVDFQMLHRTYQTRIERAPTHNTRRTHLESYQLLDEEARAEALNTARAGLEQAVARAEKSLAMRLLAPDEVTESIALGVNDTPVGGCEDVHHHPDTGLPCHNTWNFLLCLTCRNGVVAPHQLPRLVLVHQALEDLRSMLSDRAWLRWQDDYLRVHALLFRKARLTPERYAELRAKATDRDRAYVRDLLGGSYA